LLSDCFGRFPPTMVLEDGWQAFFNALLRGTSLTPKDIDLFTVANVILRLIVFSLAVS
jgi:hypothetical protein